MARGVGRGRPSMVGELRAVRRLRAARRPGALFEHQVLAIARNLGLSPAAGRTSSPASEPRSIERVSPETVRCSNASRESGEPMLGSAPVARRWLLIEHPGPWSKDHLETPRIAGPSRAPSRPAAPNSRAARSSCAARSPHPGRGACLVCRRLGPRNLGHRHVAHERRPPRRGRRARRALTQSESLAEPMLLVCTQGTRDACCALRGRPVTAALAKVWPDEVWECTHLGGHRFAGTFISMPDGTCYGTVDLPNAVEVVRSHRSGEVDARTCVGSPASRRRSRPRPARSSPRTGPRRSPLPAPAPSTSSPRP